MLVLPIAKVLNIYYYYYVCEGGVCVCVCVLFNICV